MLYSKFFKRILDLFLSVFLFITLSPLFLLISIMIKIDSKGPILFKQKRIGKSGKIFEMLKFRSMFIGTEKIGTGVYSFKNDNRVTKVGKFLRIFSLDELPQILNIIKGEMSFIGPRPPLTYHPWEFNRYNEEQLKMFNVPPGITGWAQINGRKNVEWHKRINLNIWYVNNICFLLDLKIFLLTIVRVLSTSNNYSVLQTIHKNKFNLDDKR